MEDFLVAVGGRRRRRPEWAEDRKRQKLREKHKKRNIIQKNIGFVTFVIKKIYKFNN